MTNHQKTPAQGIPKTKTLNLFLWVAQGIIALSLIWAAAMKLFQSPDKLAEMWPWTVDNTGLVKFTGILDLLGGIGVILPSLLRIKPKLTIYAAYGIVALMIAAGTFHLTRGEGAQIGGNLFFAAFAIFIAWGRSKKVPINPK